MEEDKDNWENEMEEIVEKARKFERKQAEADLKKRLDADTGDLVHKASADEYFYAMQAEIEQMKEELTQAKEEVKKLKWQVQKAQREAEDARRQAAQMKRDWNCDDKGKGKQHSGKGSWSSNSGKGKYRQQQRWW